MKIVLVASLNGAGHFNRILNLAEYFSSSDYGVDLVVGEHHYAIERSRLDSFVAIKKNRLFLLESPLGLEGPQWGEPEIQRVSTPEPDLIRALEESDLVLSDNSLWPVNYASNFAALAQFFWVDYWKNSGLGISSKLETSERSLLKKVRFRFSHPMFRIHSELASDSREISLGLLSFSTDSLVRKLPKRHEIWIANGTTGLNAVDFGGGTSVDVSAGIPILRKETFQLLSSDYRPAIVAGRPGLGTIRDCFAYGIQFVPFWDGEDFELTHNQNRLFENGFTPLSRAQSLHDLRGALKREVEFFGSEEHLPAAPIPEFLSIEEAATIILAQVGLDSD